MPIIVDVRETKLIAALGKQHTEHTVQNLELGDVHILDASSTLRLIIERKTISDLCSSIKDGRYLEQGLRLRQASNLHPNHIIYLIEGQNYRSGSITESERKMYNSALFSLTYYKGFATRWANNIDDTAYIIQNIESKLLRGDIEKRTPAYSRLHEVAIDGEATPTTCTDSLSAVASSRYEHSIKSRKKDNITTDNFASIVLSSIPGVSMNVAAALLAHFGTMRSILDHDTEIASFKVNNRAIGPKKAALVLEYVRACLQ